MLVLEEVVEVICVKLCVALHVQVMPEPTEQD